jgi:hypothetical protein
MHMAALIGRFCQSLTQGRPEPGVIVGHDKFDAVQTARLEPQQKVAPARPALPVGEFNRQHLAAAIPVDADRDHHS